MELISFVLFAGGKTLLTAIIILLTSAISGVGLSIGLHAVKKLFSWHSRKKTPSAEERAKNPNYDIFSDIEQQAGVKA
jgi:hypothetical protein